MAYAAVVSPNQILKHLLDSDPFSIHYPRSRIQSLHENINYLQDCLEYFPESKLVKTAVTDLETQIRESVYETEDTIESCISSICSRDDESYRLLDLNKKLDELIQSIDSIAEKINDLIQAAESPSVSAVKFKDELTGESFPADEANNKIVGFENEIVKLVDRLTGPLPRLEIISIVGMPGIGKTTLAKKVYQHPCISDYFNRYAFVTISPRYSVHEVLREILVQMKVKIDVWDEKTDYPFHMHVYKILMGVRFLIVLDDMLSTPIWDELRVIFPDFNTGSRILITTTMADEVAAYFGGYIHHVPFLNVAESWDLLREVVFAEESCPREFEKIGKMIAHNCQGLPLEIISIGRHLAKAEKTLEYWKKVGENKISVVTGGDDVDIFNKLYLSYENLPQYLKACFLYMGVFPQDSEIPASKLIRLWVAEGFLEVKVKGTSLEDVAKDCLKTLVDRSLVIVNDRSSRGRIKTCRVHHLFRQLCVIEAEKNKFFYVINGYTVNRFPEGTTGQRRLCIHKNIVFAIRDMNQLMRSASNARSLLCIAAHHQYPLPVCLEFRLLRVLDALTIRFYNFPVAVLTLIHLRYLALTFNGQLPTSISVLRRLQILIVLRHLRIKSSESTPSYLPMEIWNMKELRHLKCMGSDLPNPYDADQLSSLITLSDVSAQSCTKKILERIISLKKLEIRIEIVPNDHAAESSSPFQHLFLLNQLESFKCIVVNPNFGSQIVKLPDSINFFPNGLKKISLSGCGFPWKNMKMISWLPHLEVLKLRELAFKGPEWELEEEFCQLKFLLLESVDLVRWRCESYQFPCLQSLVLKHCYWLKKIPLEIAEIGTLKLIKVIDCSPSAMDSVIQIEQGQQELGNSDLQVFISFSAE